MTDAWRVIERPEKDELGEGPLWSAKENAIYWVDILSHKLFRHSLGDGSVRSWTMPERIGWVAERKDRSGFIAGFQSGFVELDLEPFAIRPIADPEPQYPGNRLNDAKVDQHGRIWAGTMDAAIKETRGALYRLDPGFNVRKMDDGYKICNGPTFSPSFDRLYHTDTGRGEVYQFDLSPEGEISNRRRFVKFTGESGWPDGMTVDSNGGIWIAHWGGSRVTRFTPDGKVDRVIKLPASQITSCVFAGPNLDRMFVTSAKEGLTGEPLAGSVFEVDAGGARGLPSLPFGG